MQKGGSGRIAAAWGAIIGLLLAAISLSFYMAPEASLDYWYLLAVPLILASVHFGVRGVLVVSGISLLVLVAAFQAAGRSVVEFLQVSEQVLMASGSAEEAVSLAAQLVDLRMAEPKTAFLRAITGIALIVVGSFMLGTSLDQRRQGTEMLLRAFNALRRYFSPQVVESIIAQSDAGSSQSTSVRKEITVLFADLRGFTSLAEQLPPEDTANLLSEFLTAMTEEVFREDGTLDKYIGDAVMAVYGDPEPYPDHTARACRTALRMQERMVELQERWRDRGMPVIGMGVGVNAGHAIVGSTGSPTRREYTAIGSCVNVAARLTDLALPGQVLLSWDTYTRVGPAFEAAAVGAVSVKGLSVPLEIVELLHNDGRDAATAGAPERLPSLSLGGSRGMLIA